MPNARVGSLWHKIAGEATPRNSPRHSGGPVCLQPAHQSGLVSVVTARGDHRVEGGVGQGDSLYLGVGWLCYISSILTTINSIQFTFNIDSSVCFIILLWNARIVRVGQFVSRQSPVAEDVNIVAVTPDLVVVHGPVHHGLPRDVVAPVGVEPEGGPDIVEPREEVESVPGALSGRLLAGADLQKIFQKFENISEVS